MFSGSPKQSIFSDIVFLLPYSWNVGWLSTNKKINPIYPHRTTSILCGIPSILQLTLYNIGCLSHIVGLILISTFLTLILIFLNLRKSIFFIPFSFLWDGINTVPYCYLNHLFILYFLYFLRCLHRQKPITNRIIHSPFPLLFLLFSLVFSFLLPLFFSLVFCVDFYI